MIQFIQMYNCIWQTLDRHTFYSLQKSIPELDNILCLRGLSHYLKEQMSKHSFIHIRMYACPYMYMNIVCMSIVCMCVYYPN